MATSSRHHCIAAMGHLLDDQLKQKLPEDYRTKNDSGLDLGLGHYFFV